MIYVLALNDYEDYKPYWFECDCSKEVFEVAVRDAIDFATHFLVDIQKEDRFINGYNILEHAVQRLQDFNEYKLIKADYEIRIHGECLYTEDEEKPEPISDGSWEKIIRHNEAIRSEIYRKVK